MHAHQTQRPPHIAVLGAGFGGLAFCRACKAEARITLIDKYNHHLFQPLLYQVATAGLSAPEVAEPARSIFRNDERVTVLMDTARRIDLPGRRIELAHGAVGYDYLVLALGGQTHYFGNDGWADHAPGLKSLTDAMRIRWKLLRAFETAEATDDPELRRRLMTIVVIGGGPTGVELAGAVAELTKVVFKRDFRNINPADANIILIESGDHVLDQFPEKLARKALPQLQSLGVRVRLNERVTDVQADHVALRSGDRIDTFNTLWAAGVRANAITATLGIELGPGGRIPVAPDLSVPGYPEAFAIGDIVTLTDPNGVLAPGLAPAAMQMGKHVAALIDHRIATGRVADPGAEPFVYRDRGSMATIGRKRAIAKIGRLELSGPIAWLAWLWVHLIFLIGFRNKVAVLLSWLYSYITFRRGARIIFDARGDGAGESTDPDTPRVAAADHTHHNAPIVAPPG